METLVGGPHDGLSVPINRASSALGRLAVVVGGADAVPGKRIGWYVRDTDGRWGWED